MIQAINLTELETDLTQLLHRVKTEGVKIAVSYFYGRRIVGFLVPLEQVPTTAKRSLSIGMTQFRDRCGYIWDWLEHDFDYFLVTKRKRPMIAFVSPRFADSLGAKEFQFTSYYYYLQEPQK